MLQQSSAIQSQLLFSIANGLSCAGRAVSTPLPLAGGSTAHWELLSAGEVSCVTAAAVVLQLSA